MLGEFTINQIFVPQYHKSPENIQKINMNL